jgi:hypothetical protein
MSFHRCEPRQTLERLYSGFDFDSGHTDSAILDKGVTIDSLVLVGT